MGRSTCVSAINERLHTMYVEEIYFVKCLVIGVACSEKEDRIRKIKVEVDPRPHPRRKMELPHRFSSVPFIKSHLLWR
ncbi:hypothetical protein TNCV_3904581 [Trichonephila clavipes]|nr:hypothetical protein TNCV_3904581 [Trichonephila clavipes]